MGFPSAVRHGYDAEPSVLLRTLADGAETASAVEVGKPLHTLNAAIWDNNTIPFESFSAVFHVSSIDKTTGDETYSLQVQVDTDQGFAGSNFAVVGSIQVNSVGVFVVNLDGPTIKAQLNGAAFIRAALVAGGTTPSINYEAWLAPSVGQQ